jgi:5-methylthioadenosine/S-adenosylhomocysteine deaminase
MVHSRHCADRVLSLPQSIESHHHDGSAARGHAARRAELSILRITAGTVWPVTTAPFGAGAVLVDGSGRIEAVGPDADVPHPSGVAEVAYRNALILPGFVNLHTHLELHAFADRMVAGDFFGRIQGMRQIRDTVGDGEYDVSAVLGLEETWRYGITTVADTGVSGAAVRAIDALGGRGVYYQEAIGPNPVQASAVLAELAATLKVLRRNASDRVCIGVSPHAPYTVSPRLLEALVAFAASWRQRGLALPPKARSAVAYADRCGVLGPDTLAIHAVQTDEDDIRRLRDTGTATAVCPRSNRAHAHGDPRLAAMREAGVRFGLGTDSAVSVGTLDVMAEARVARAVAGLPADETIRRLTIDAAQALGWEAEIGSLERGKWADLWLLALGRGEADQKRTAERILDARGDAVLATYVAGRQVWNRGAGGSSQAERGDR